MLIVLDVHEGMDPSPRVDVTVTSLGGTVTQMRVVQVSPAGEVLVRDASPMPAAGSGFVTDFEVPLGVEVSYRAEGLSSTGALVESDTAGPAIVGGITSQQVIIQDPLVPSLAVVVDGRGSFASSLTRGRDSSRYRAGGRTVVLMGEQGLLEGIDLSVAIDDSATADALDVVLQAGVVLVRTLAPVVLPRALYAAIPTSIRVPVTVYDGGDLTWVSMTADEVSRDVLSTLQPLITWQRFIDFYPTWTALIAAHPTWLSLLTDPPPEV